MRYTIVALSVSLMAVSCFAGEKKTPPAEPLPVREETVFYAPDTIPRELIEQINREKERFVPALEQLIANDSETLLVLVDKQHRLPESYSPPDLVPVTTGRSYIPNRGDLSLRKGTEAALERMAAAALENGIKLVVSSTYRSWKYQEGLYDRNVRQLGKEAADRESAPPGASQHQLGTVVDFGSITDDFAQTAAGKWLAENAARFGWSLSFPDGYEAVTGYRWECWHYRYIGPEAAAFQKEWFGDVQQYMLEFIDAWIRWKGVGD